jgi:hypothetical protein
VSGASTLAPPPRAAEAAQPRVSRGWLPGAVLLLGLAVTALVVNRAPNVSVRSLHEIHGDGAMLHEVGGTYVAGWLSPDWNPFVEGRFRILTLLATIVYMTSVTAIGATLIGAIRGSADWPRVARLLAGFLPGYLIVLGPLQLLFSCVYYVTAAWITLIALPLIAIALQRRALVSTAHDLRHDSGYRRRWLGATVAIVAILVLWGVDRLQSGREFMVPDSITVFLQTAGQQLRGVFGSYLAQWDQQSDEWMFNAPLVFTSTGAQDYLFPFYATQFVGLASFGGLVFGVVHSLAWRRRTLAAALATGAILASTPSIFPWYNIPLVGGQNATMWLAHTGRLVEIVAPWVALLLLGRRHPPRVMAMILLATVGLAFTTISSTVYVVAALGSAGAWSLLRGRVPSLAGRRAPAAVVHGCAALALAAPIFVYWRLHHTTSPNSLGWILVAGALLAGAAAVLVTLSARASALPLRGLAPQQKSGGAAISVRVVLALAGALAVGFIISNNMISGVSGVRSTLASILPGYSLPVESRGIVGGQPHLTFPMFTGQECSISGHCLSFGYFLAGYGFVTMIALAGWLALGRISDDAQTSGRRAAWLLTVAAFGTSLALVDFSGASQLTSWVLTRFIEVPYYALLAFGAIAFAASRSRLTTYTGAAVLAAWTIIPLASSHVVPQLARNANWFIEVIY